jgi:Tfp pilus assembly protein PilF
LFYAHIGKIDQAEDELRKAITLDANDRDAQKGLAVLQSLPAAQPE